MRDLHWSDWQLQENTVRTGNSDINSSPRGAAGPLVMVTVVPASKLTLLASFRRYSLVFEAKGIV